MKVRVKSFKFLAIKDYFKYQKSVQIQYIKKSLIGNLHLLGSVEADRAKGQFKPNWTENESSENVFAKKHSTVSIRTVNS